MGGRRARPLTLIFSESVLVARGPNPADWAAEKGRKRERPRLGSPSTAARLALVRPVFAGRPSSFEREALGLAGVGLVGLTDQRRGLVVRQAAAVAGALGAAVLEQHRRVERAALV